jgi:SNF2 family DNA or RNA helicase
MIALHIAFCEEEILLWSESEQIGLQKDVKKALKALNLTLIAKKKVKSFYAWLPCKGGEALPSNPLLKAEPAGKHKIDLKAHPIEAIPLDFENLTDLLLTTTERMEHGVMIGSTVKWIANLFSLAVDLVIKELFVPILEAKKENYLAVWKPLPDDSDVRHLKRLQKELPAALRCVQVSSSEPPNTPGEIVLTQLLDSMVDGLIRNHHTLTPTQREDSVHDAWLNALVSQNSVLKWSKKSEIEDFVKQLSIWSRQIFLSANSPYKLCFRLLEPSSEKEDWKLEYLLQSKEDMSILIPMAMIWSKKKQDLEMLKKIEFDSIELPLLLLGQAAGIYPPLANSLKPNQAGQVHLSTQSAMDFLLTYAEILSRMGFSVLLPAWWKGTHTERKLSLHLRVESPKLQGKAGMSLTSILQFDYQASLGDEKISLKELMELAKLKSPLVRIRGQWTFIDAKQIQECIQFLKKQKDNVITAGDLVQISIGNKSAPVEIEKIEASGWVEKLLAGLNEKKGFKKLPQPKTFTGTLRDYQQKGYSWLAYLKQWGLGTCLADDMGLGKTIQTLALLQQEADGGEKRPVLLICPTTVLNNWRKEAERFTPNLKTLVHHGSERKKTTDFAKTFKGTALVISSFGLLHRDLESLKQIDWAGIIIDEAQNIKNPQTKQAKAVRALTADYRIALTGTPVENHVGDLWSIMEFLNPGMLGSLQQFKERFHKPITLYKDDSVAQHLKKIVSPFILRRLKTDKSIIKDLPDKIESKEYCTLTKEQASLYQAVADEVQKQIEEAEGIARKGMVLAALTRLKQVCNHPAQYFQDNSALFGRSGKLQRTLDLLSEIFENGERTLIFTQYYEMGSILQQVIQEHFGRETFFLHGKVPKKKRDEMIERFQNSETAPFFFILSLKAGGTGITLTRANNVIHYDRWWNPAVEKQATDRAFRIGQHQNVQVHKLIVSGTLEEKIDDLLMQKEEVANQVVGSGEAWLSELSNNDFKSLISLSQSAIGEE